MKRVEFALKTVTPMFMAGENQAAFELRPPSLKGLMRFWWRAYCWGKHPETLTPQEIEEKEGKIFGTGAFLPL